MIGIWVPVMGVMVDFDTLAGRSGDRKIGFYKNYDDSFKLKPNVNVSEF